jgi:hypothetical protein
MKSARIIAGLLAVLGLLYLLSGPQAQASNDIAKKTGQQCSVCHDKPGSRRLTNKGLYFQQLGTLDGYDQVVAFGECVTCHDRRPGSKKLTPTGRRFLSVVKDMKGLRSWLEQNHPGMQPPPPPTQH